MQKVARGPLGGKGRDTRKVANNGSYAHCCAIEHALVRLPSPDLVSASIRALGPRKNCDPQFGLGDQHARANAPAGRKSEVAGTCRPRNVAIGAGALGDGRPASRGLTAGARDAGRSAANAPGGNDLRGGTAGSGNRNPIADAPGRGAGRTADRPARAASRGLLSALRLELLSRNSARHLSALRALTGGAS